MFILAHSGPGLLFFHKAFCYRAAIPFEGCRQGQLLREGDGSRLLEGHKSADKWANLDHEEIRKALLDFSGGCTFEFHKVNRREVFRLFALKS